MSEIPRPSQMRRDAETHRDAAERLVNRMPPDEAARIHALLAIEERIDALVYLSNGGAGIPRLTLESTPPQDCDPPVSHSSQSAEKAQSRTSGGAS